MILAVVALALVGEVPAPGPFGTLSMRGTPWVDVEVDGVKIGTTTFMHARVPAGRHTLTLTNREVGIHETREIIVRPDVDNYVEFKWRGHPSLTVRKPAAPLPASVATTPLPPRPLPAPPRIDDAMLARMFYDEAHPPAREPEPALSERDRLLEEIVTSGLLSRVRQCSTALPTRVLTTFTIHVDGTIAIGTLGPPPATLDEEIARCMRAALDDARLTQRANEVDVAFPFVAGRRR